jgi:hypothetical protein
MSSRARRQSFSTAGRVAAALTPEAVAGFEWRQNVAVAGTAYVTTALSGGSGVYSIVSVVPALPAGLLATLAKPDPGQEVYGLVVTGTPTVAYLGANITTFTVTDSAHSVPVSLRTTITVAAPLVVSAVSTPLTLTQGVAYSGSPFSVSGGYAPYTHAISGFPTEIVTTSAGTASGTPANVLASTTAGDVVTDRLGATASASLQYSVVASSTALALLPMVNNSAVEAYGHDEAYTGQNIVGADTLNRHLYVSNILGTGKNGTVRRIKQGDPISSGSGLRAENSWDAQALVHGVDYWWAIQPMAGEWNGNEPSTSNMIIWQIHQKDPAALPGPTFEIGVNGAGNLTVSRVYGPSPIGTEEYPITALGTVAGPATGVWTRFVVHLRFGPTTADAPVIQVWKNETLVLNLSGTAALVGQVADQNNYSRIGFYKWNYSVGDFGANQTRAAFYSELYFEQGVSLLAKANAATAPFTSIVALSAAQPDNWEGAGWDIQPYSGATFTGCNTSTQGTSGGGAVAYPPSGWPNNSADGIARIQRFTNLGPSANQAGYIKRVKAGDAWNWAGHRSEYRQSALMSDGVDYWFSFAMNPVSGEWPGATGLASDQQIFFQMHHQNDSTQPGPSFALLRSGIDGSLRMGRAYNTTGSGSGTGPADVSLGAGSMLSLVPAGAWSKFAVHLRFGTDANARIEVYINGTRVIDLSGTNAYMGGPGDGGTYWKYGFYFWAGDDDASGTAYGATKTRAMYQSELYFGQGASLYNEAMASLAGF